MVETEMKNEEVQMLCNSSGVGSKDDGQEVGKKRMSFGRDELNLRLIAGHPGGDVWETTEKCKVPGTGQG